MTSGIVLYQTDGVKKHSEENKMLTRHHRGFAKPMSLLEIDKLCYIVESSGEL